MCVCGFSSARMGLSISWFGVVGMHLFSGFLMGECVETPEAPGSD